MGNGLFLALALSGGGVSQGTLEALTAMRQRNYEKLCLFIKWLASTLVYGYYWLKKHPEVLDETTKKPDLTGKGTQAFIDAFWMQSNQKDFIANMVREGADLLMAWLKPDDFESKLWSSIVQRPSQSAQTNQLLQALMQPGALAALLQQQQQGGGQQQVNSAPPGSAANPISRPRGGNL